MEKKLSWILVEVFCTITYRVPVLNETLVVAGKRDQEQDCRDVLRNLFSQLDFSGMGPLRHPPRNNGSISAVRYVVLQRQTFDT